MLIVRVCIVTPLPAQSGHGSSISLPVPLQSRHGSLKPNAPWLWLTKPEPEQVGQVRADVPGLAPLPPHVRQVPGPDSCSGSVSPLIASSKLSVTSALASWPRVGPVLRARRWLPPPPNRLPNMSPNRQLPTPPPVCANKSLKSNVVEPPRVRAGRIATGATGESATGTRPLANSDARLVVLRALGRIRQHVVGLGDFLELRLGRGIARVLVRVQLHRQLAISLLDRARVGILGDAQRRVIVLLEPVLSAHRESPPFVVTFEDDGKNGHALRAVKLDPCVRAILPSPT